MDLKRSLLQLQLQMIGSWFSLSCPIDAMLAYFRTRLFFVWFLFFTVKVWCQETTVLVSTSSQPGVVPLAVRSPSFNAWLVVGNGSVSSGPTAWNSRVSFIIVLNSFRGEFERNGTVSWMGRLCTD